MRCVGCMRPPRPKCTLGKRIRYGNTRCISLALMHPTEQLMSTALLYKEFRETLPIAVVGLACLLCVALSAMGSAPIPYLLSGNSQGAIPFVGWGDSFSSNFRMVAGAFALALGFWHALGDSWGEAHLFLLHRPVSRRSIY